MGKIGNCPVCGKLYMEAGQHMCRDCYEKELEDETTVATFVRDNEKATVKEICEGTGVKERVVMRMIKAGRFIETGIQITYPCESCGAPITRGRLCDRCNADLMQQVAAVRSKRVVKPTDRSHGMYTRQDEDGSATINRRKRK